MSALVIIEHHEQQLSIATQSAITAATAMASSVKALILGKITHEVAEIVRKIECIDEVYTLTGEEYEHFLAEPCAEAIVKFSQQTNNSAFTHIVAAATSFGKNILPRVAALLDVAQISDIVAVLAADKYQRPIYAGNALATLQSLDALQVITVRATAFAPALIGNHLAPVIPLDFSVTHTQASFISHSSVESERPQLNSADIIISGGRGLGDESTFERLANIATLLHAALGASRAAVDAGFAPNELQVGQTGQIVAPKLYIAVGISGAIQHLAGMKDSRVIVAINKDPDAPIFKIADYGLVGDIKEILPQWEAWLSQQGQ